MIVLQSLYSARDFDRLDRDDGNTTIVGRATTPKSYLFRRGIEGVLCPGKVAKKR